MKHFVETTRERTAALSQENPEKSAPVQDEIDKALQPPSPIVKPFDPETDVKYSSHNGWASDSDCELTFADSTPSDSSKAPSGISEKKSSVSPSVSGMKRKRHGSPRAAAHSPDITAQLSSPVRKKSSTLDALVSRLAESEARSAPNYASYVSSKSPSPVSDDVEETEPEERNKRESSVTSTASSSSCVSASESMQQIRSIISTKTRGRGLSRVRGGSTNSYSGRGRGRGQIPPTPRYVPPISQTLPPAKKTTPRPVKPKPKPKPKVPGEEKKRKVVRRKKVDPRNLLDVSNQKNQEELDKERNHHGILKEKQKLNDTENSKIKSPPAPTKDGAHAHAQPNMTVPNLVPDFVNNNLQHYERYEVEKTRNILPVTHQEIKTPHEVPAKMRHKTKHTVLIKDEMETDGLSLSQTHRHPTPNRKTQHLVDHNNDLLGLKYKSHSDAPSLSSSVILKSTTPSRISSSPPRIINPLTKSQSPGKMIGSSSSTSSSPTTTTTYNVSYHPSPVFSTTLNRNNFHKKRTQVLTPTTYQPQPESPQLSEMEMGSSPPIPASAALFTVSPSSGVTLTPSGTFATASSLAGRSRPTIYDHRTQTVITASSIPSSLALPSNSATVTSVVRTGPGQTQLVQRKVHPHILATSKYRIPVGSPQGTPTSTANSSNVPNSNNMNNSNSLVQSGALPVSSLQNIQVQNFKPTSGVGGTTFSMGNTTVPIGTSTMNMARTSQGTNIIFVQKNVATGVAGQTISTVSTLPAAAGAGVKL